MFFHESKGKLRLKRIHFVVQSNTCDPGKSIPVGDGGCKNKFLLMREEKYESYAGAAF